MKLSTAINHLEKAVKGLEENNHSVFLGDGTLFIVDGKEFPFRETEEFDQFSEKIIYEISTTWDGGAF